MSFLFGGSDLINNRQKTPIQDMQAQLRNAMRTIARDSSKSKSREENLVREIKAYGKNNKLQQCSMKAKELVRCRQQQSKLDTTYSQLGSLLDTVSNMSATKTMQDSVQGTAKLLRNLNASIDAKGIIRLMQDFQKQSDLFNTSQETIDESIDSALQAENEENVSEDTVTAVLEELGLDADRILKQATPVSFTSHDLSDRLSRLKTKAVELH